MSVCLDLQYELKKEIQDLPVVIESRLSYDSSFYSFHVGCGMTPSPLTRLLIDERHLNQGLGAERITGVKFIKRSMGKHDAKTMLAIAIAVKDRLEKEGDEFLKTMGLELNFHEDKSRDVLKEQLEDLILFCEFGIKNKLKEYKHWFQ